MPNDQHAALEALKAAIDAFQRRFRAGGINGWESNALAACQEALRALTGHAA